MFDDLYFIAEHTQGTDFALQKIISNNVMNSVPGSDTTIREIEIPNDETWSHLDTGKDGGTAGLVFYYVVHDNGTRNIRMFSGGIQNLMLEFGSLNPGHPASTENFVSFDIEGEFLFLKTMDTTDGDSQMRIYNLQSLLSSSGADVSSALVHDFSWDESLATATLLRGNMPSIVIHSPTSDSITVKTSPGGLGPWSDMTVALEERIEELLLNEPMQNGQRAALHYKNDSMEFRTAILDLGTATFKEVVGNDINNLDNDGGTIFTKMHGLELYDIDHTFDGGLILGVKGAGPLFPNKIIKMTPVDYVGPE